MMSDAETLQKLRKRLCHTEVLGTLRHLADEASELAGIADESLRGDIADLQDRLAAKIERLGGIAVAKRPQSSADFAELDGGGLLKKLRAVHGEAGRPDIAPELLAAISNAHDPPPP
jgi:hypothetical protein